MCVCVCIYLSVWRREDVAELFSQICICNWRWWRSSRQQELPPDCAAGMPDGKFRTVPTTTLLYILLYLYVCMYVCVCEKLRHFYANNVLQEFLLFIVKIPNVWMRLRAKCKWVCKEEGGGGCKGVCVLHSFTSYCFISYSHLAMCRQQRAPVQLSFSVWGLVYSLVPLPLPLVSYIFYVCRVSAVKLDFAACAQSNY